MIFLSQLINLNMNPIGYTYNIMHICVFKCFISDFVSPWSYSQLSLTYIRGLWKISVYVIKRLYFQNFPLVNFYLNVHIYQAYSYVNTFIFHNQHRVQFCLFFSSWFLSQYCGTDTKKVSRLKLPLTF